MERGECLCGSGKQGEEIFDGQGIYLTKVCPDCKERRMAGFRPEILRAYTQADVDEPIEPES